MADTEEHKCFNEALCNGEVYLRDVKAGGDVRGECD